MGLPNPFTASGAKILAACAAALAIACLCLWLWGRAGYASADRWEAKSIAERDAHRQTKANVAAAQVQAAAAAKVRRVAAEQTSRQLAERADHAEDDLAAARAAAARFADARRLPVSTGSAAGGAPGGTGAAAQADAAAGGDRPGADAVVLKRSEFDDLAGNTLRLEAVRRWGEQLINAGLAVPADQNRKED